MYIILPSQNRRLYYIIHVYNKWLIEGAYEHKLFSRALLVVGIYVWVIWKNNNERKAKYNIIRWYQ